MTFMTILLWILLEIVLYPRNKSHWRIYLTPIHLSLFIVPVLFNANHNPHIYFDWWILYIATIIVQAKFNQIKEKDTTSSPSYGTRVLSHTIKNEIGKIRIVAHEIQTLASKSKEKGIEREAAIVINSTDHVLEMVARVQSHSNEIVLKEGVHDLSKILNLALQSSKRVLDNKNIRVKRGSFLQNAPIWCDSTHMQETFQNIIMNAMEAMNFGGMLSVSLNETRNQFLITFMDDGGGIPEDNMESIFDPFYSTKNEKLNFGIGLTYCHSVVQKHGGSIEVQSELHVGTTVTIRLPKRKIHTWFLPNFGGKAFGNHQSYAG